MSSHSTPDDRTQAELLHDLRYGLPGEQKVALARLAEVGEAEALDAIVEYLRDPSANLSGEALETLRVLAHKYMPLDRYGLAEALIPILNVEKWDQRLVAIRLVNAYPNELAVEPLRTVIYEAQEKLYTKRGQMTTRDRLLTERSLGEGVMALANSGRLLVLADILFYIEDPSLRIVATRALGLIGSETERPRLEDLAEDRDPRVRDAAQWALSLMDERAEQFLNPPLDPPPLPPDRLNPLYWVHRQLVASDQALEQFLIVRVAIEHLILDRFVSDGQVPEVCSIILRRYEGDKPPSHKDNQAVVIGVWEYHWSGPHLRKRAASPGGLATRLPTPLGRGAILTISYPEHLPLEKEGLVSFDCQFQPFEGEGWIYRVARRDEGWTFTRQESTWST
jgi:hypothetical protein